MAGSHYRSVVVLSALKLQVSSSLFSSLRNILGLGKMATYLLLLLSSRYPVLCQNKFSLQVTEKVVACGFQNIQVECGRARAQISMRRWIPSLQVTQTHFIHRCRDRLDVNELVKPGERWYLCHYSKMSWFPDPQKLPPAVSELFLFGNQTNSVSATPFDSPDPNVATPEILK